MQSFKMFAKLFRGVLPLFRAVESEKCLQVIPSHLNRCNLLSCYRRGSSKSLLRSQPSLFTSPGIASRFQSTTSNVPADPPRIPENLKSVLGKPRNPRRRSKVSNQVDKGYSVIAFSTAEEYDLEGLKEVITKNQQMYGIISEDEVFKVQDSGHQGEDVVHIKAKSKAGEEPREAFFFREGTVVFWNLTDLEVSNLVTVLRPFETSSYDEKLVLSERELMSYIHGDSTRTVLRNDVIELAYPDDDSGLEKYSFSNGIALSVKLGIWEASLEKFIDSIEFISEDLKAGHKIKMTREEVLQKQGELFALRHLVNLSSDLLDTPDFYWDNEDLEKLFLQTVRYYCISRRTKVMNEKISHCSGLVELVSSHLSEKHHVRLEWMVILLIMVECIFEFLHFIKP